MKQKEFDWAALETPLNLFNTNKINQNSMLISETGSSGIQCNTTSGQYITMTFRTTGTQSGNFAFANHYNWTAN